MDPFAKVAIGNTGVAVTRLGLGGAPLGGMVLADGIFTGSSYDEALAIIRRAYELGVRYFDTAPMYGNGRSEVRYGRVLGVICHHLLRSYLKIPRVTPCAKEKRLGSKVVSLYEKRSMESCLTMLEATQWRGKLPRSKPAH